MISRLNVFRRLHGSYCLAGQLSSVDEEMRFTYSETYFKEVQREVLSAALPVEHMMLDAAETKGFFEGLLPEGSFKQLLFSAAHLDTSDYASLLSRLNNETAGAFVFSVEPAIDESAFAYQEMPYGKLCELAKNPKDTSLEVAFESRLSIAGAQAKIGLYHTGNDWRRGWHKALAGAPTTHIVKASAHEGQTINEALCLLAAKRLDFDVTDCALLPVEHAEPLLAVRRFDRPFATDAKPVGGLAVPERLHQEDFHQILANNRMKNAGFFDKYEPADGHYAAHCASVIAKISTNSFGDKMAFFSRLLFDLLIGNSDNHLKNHSIVWASDDKERLLSPLYDITHTLMYPYDREMGVSFSSSRLPDAVTMQDITHTAETCGISERFAVQEFHDMQEKLPTVLQQTVHDPVFDGFEKEAKSIADIILASMNERTAHLS